ncbi:hypothetical protein PUW84_00680 [Metamycoplasma hyosynoviae]|uniref:hypothetical protein n=1 Tax=Metamycoplasma hyosynoviae TaxID=29559 RepID=UPI00046187EF|nr:hypothetical protein [Metamycoplasma hyosynoviae]KDE41905.1 hypothetical protein NPL3_02870 [Metamycoplasma hyosynoviae]KDE43308.1 hypothetical protein NPL5_02585 [Metamycoplasma hyosynoviae]KDE45216.1 hypothetical protein NPL4_02070 [Metamycoplasma hyosynoviae]KDE45220.1 hypothetical protein NPL2_01455 [Metamycoplasma hyosynoviae]MDD7893324.1 hypothetical protein [Metamycoplasma hyosynoviae]
MELTKISEVVDKSVLQTFYIKLIPVTELSTTPGAVNVVNFDLKKLPKIKAMISDLSYNQMPVADIIDTDAKYSIIFDEKLEISNQVLILKNASKEYEYFIVENFTTTYSPSQVNEVNNIAVAQKIEDYIYSKKFIILPNVSETPSEKLDITIKDNFLLQNAHIETIFGEKREVIFRHNMLPMLVNPIEVNEETQKVFMPFLSKFSNIDVRDICVTENSYAIFKDNQLDSRYAHFFQKIYEIYHNQNLISSGFANKPKEEVEEFKKIYNGNNAEEYVNYEISLLRNSSQFSKEQIDHLILMCSGFLKSSFCIGGGFSNFHKYLLPFYFEMIGETIYLKSEFYELNDKREIAKVVAK